MTSTQSNVNSVRPGMPEDFKASHIDNTSALLTWVLPNDANTYKGFISVPGATEVEKEVVGGQLRIEELAPDSEFLFCLQLESQLGQRSRPAYVSFKTLVDPVTAPSELRVLQDAASSVTLGWKAAGGGVAPRIYEISINDVIYMTTDQLTASVDNLAPDAEYKFTVACSDKRGSFSPSISILHSTPSSLTMPGVIASPRHDPHEFEISEAALQTGFSGAELEFVVKGGKPPYKVDLLGSTAATVSGLVVTLLSKANIPLVIEDSLGAKVTYRINPLHWFSTPSNTALNHGAAAAGGALPDVHVMSNRGGPGSRQVGTLCSEWGDLTQYGWPKLSDSVYYWTKNPSPEPPVGQTYEAVGVGGNTWGGRVQSLRYYVSYVS